MTEKSRSSVVHLRTWRPRSSAKASTQGRQPTSGRSACFCMPFSAANSRSEVRTTRSCTIIFRNKSFNSQTMCRLQQGSSFRNCSIKHRKDASVPSRSSRTHGRRLVHKSTKCSAQLSWQAAPSRATELAEQVSIKPSVCNLEPEPTPVDSKIQL